MDGCPRCESLMAYSLNDNLYIHMTVPVGHTYIKLKKHLQSLLSVNSLANGHLEFKLTASTLEAFSNHIKKILSYQEMADSYVMLLNSPSDVLPPHVALNATQPLSSFIGLISSQWLIRLIKNKQLTSWFQPIVDSSTHKPFAYECLLRGFDDNNHLIGANEIFTAAKAADMLFLVDRQARITAIETASASHEVFNKLFINFNPTSVYDPEFCLRTTDDAVKKAGFKTRDIVFEVTESEQVKDRKHLLEITRFYRERGYGIALDDLGSGYSSLNMLHELEPDYVKLDMDLIRNIHQSPVKQMMVEKISELASNLNIKTIAEGIECSEELECLKYYPIDYYQGYLFGKPAPLEDQ